MTTLAAFLVMCDHYANAEARKTWQALEPTLRLRGFSEDEIEAAEIKFLAAVADMRKGVEVSALKSWQRIQQGTHQ